METTQPSTPIQFKPEPELKTVDLFDKLLVSTTLNLLILL